ncbi:MAG: efflux RND transporter permease subunit [Rikenellaceae bacterium]|jgi:multidrug efflux pump subunit AcrB|nr:efflux RND transporter permease subunit [Rikenellaceae bacterium]
MLRKLIEKPIAVTMTLIAIVVLGVVAANLLPVSLMPDVPIPNITVQVSAPGQSARQVDMGVIAPLRSQLMQVQHLTDIRTESRDDGGNIYLQFEYGTNVDFLFIEVNEKIDRSMNSLARDLERPRVIKASATDIPAFYLNVTLKEPDSAEVSSEPSRRFLELSSFITQVIVKRIEQIPQVAMVDLSGTVYPQLLIVPKSEKLEALGIGLGEIEQAIRNNNIDLGNLTIHDGEYRYNIRFENRLIDQEDIENVYLNVHGRLYQLRELAEVIEQPQPRAGMVRSDGRDAVTLAVIKQSDAKMKELRQQMNNLLASFEQDYPEIDFAVTRDQTELLAYSINNLKGNIVLAAVLACLILFLFMADFRSAALIGITIPLSLIVSLFFFHLIGISINVISLSGMILCVGMMVDNTIIVLDNIGQYWSRGLPLRQAIVRGAGEVFTPMLSSVLTTVSVFVPLIFLSGIAGALFYDQAMAVSIGLLVSLFVAVGVIPVYYLLFYKRFPTPPVNRYLAHLDISERMSVLYERMLKGIFRHRGLVWVLFIAVIPAAVLLYRVIDKERLPQLSHDDMILNVDWNQMLSIAENDRRTRSLSEAMQEWTQQNTSLIGVQDFLLAHTDELSASEASLYVQGANPEAIAQLEEQIAAFLQANYPEASFSFGTSGNIFEMIFSDTEAPLIARLRQKDGQAPAPDKLNTLLAELSAAIPEIQFEPVLWNEHQLLVPDQELMTLYNVDYQTLFSVLKNSVDQNQLLTLTDGSILIPVLSGNNLRSEDILRRSVVGRDSTVVPLRTLLTETRERDLKSIVSGKEGNYYPLSLQVSSREVPDLMRRIGEVVRENDGYEVEFSGSYFSNRSMIRELIVVLLVSLLLLYFILSAQFESVIQPLIILSEVIVDIFGAMLLLWVCGASINLMSLIGIVVMCGIVINDSILKVDTINRLRKEGYSLLRAILTGGGRRLKPIVMTSLTTILALLPFLSRGSLGDDLQYPLSLALIGGMIVGTLVSVFFVPLVYFEIYKRKAYAGKGK